MSALFGGIHFIFFRGKKFCKIYHLLSKIFSVGHTVSRALFIQLTQRQNPWGQLLKYGQSGWTKCNRIVCFDFPVNKVIFLRIIFLPNLFYRHF